MTGCLLLPSPEIAAVGCRVTVGSMTEHAVMHDDDMSNWQVRCDDTGELVSFGRSPAVVSDAGLRFEHSRIEVLNLPGSAQADLFWSGVPMGHLVSARRTEDGALALAWDGENGAGTVRVQL